MVKPILAQSHGVSHRPRNNIDPATHMIGKARIAAADHLAHCGYLMEAEAVRSGSGDDYAEVRIADALLRIEDKRLRGLERALAIYAAPSFWEDEGSGLSDATTDAGTIARHALAGIPVPDQYYD